MASDPTNLISGTRGNTTVPSAMAYTCVHVKSAYRHPQQRALRHSTVSHLQVGTVEPGKVLKELILRRRHGLPQERDVLSRETKVVDEAQHLHVTIP